MGDGVDLSGTWLAAPSEEATRRRFADPGFDDTGWERITVPGHWRSVPAFADSDGPLLHRRSFTADAPAPGDRSWLVLEGVLYQGDVWLDGAYVGDTEGYFASHAFEIGDALADRTEHVVAVEVTCAPQRDRRSRRNLTGVLQDWDCVDPSWNPGGLWRPVRIERTGAVRVRTFRVLCSDATEQRATLTIRAALDADRARPVRLRTTVGGVEHQADRQLAEGRNWVEWEVRVDDPALWWPRALGAQPLVDVDVEVILPDEGGVVSHRRHRRIGLRRAEWRGWTLHVNGERLFLKGANVGPTRRALADATPAEVAGDVALAVEAGLDLLRVHGHVARNEVYDAADEAGVLLWQDLPLQWGYARGVRRQAQRQAHRAVDVLGHHPSIVLWCGHNEPPAAGVAPRGTSWRPAALRYALGLQLPSWNRSVLDRSIGRALRSADGTRRVIPWSGVPAGPWSRGRDTHLYLGWYEHDVGDLPRAAALVPRLVQFVSEFGTQAVPTTDGFAEPARWPDLDWERLEREHSLQRAQLERWVPTEGHATLASWRDATQAYQAAAIRRFVEELRRLKYRPTGGFAQFLLADAQPAITWSVVDHQRVPKAGFAALRAACAPVIVVADRLDADLRPGGTVALDVHVVSDLRQALDAVTVTADLSWPGGGTHRWRWRGAVPADACTRVGTIAWVVPDAPGDVHLDLALEGCGVVAANADVARISSS